MKVYLVWCNYFNGCDCFETLDSIHRTREGAEEIMKSLNEKNGDTEHRSYFVNEEEVIE